MADGILAFCEEGNKKEKKQEWMTDRKIPAPFSLRNGPSASSISLAVTGRTKGKHRDGWRNWFPPSSHRHRMARRKRNSKQAVIETVVSEISHSFLDLFSFPIPIYLRLRSPISFTGTADVFFSWSRDDLPQLQHVEPRPSRFRTYPVYKSFISLTSNWLHQKSDEKIPTGKALA